MVSSEAEERPDLRLVAVGYYSSVVEDPRCHGPKRRWVSCCSLSVIFAIYLLKDRIFLLRWDDFEEFIPENFFEGAQTRIL
jgi:hypothetical protein